MKIRLQEKKLLDYINLFPSWQINFKLNTNIAKEKVSLNIILKKIDKTKNKIFCRK